MKSNLKSARVKQPGIIKRLISSHFALPIFVLVFAGIGVYMLRNSFAVAPSIVCPLPGRPAITSGYRTSTRPNHAGIDIGVKTGTPIYAPQDGTMGNKRVDSDGYGLYVDLANGSYRYRFAHLQSVVVATGAVKAGQLIAYSDSGGDATGPHLHFEIRTNPSQISYGVTNTINPTTSYNSCTSPGGGQAPSSGGGSTSGCSNHPTIRQSATGGGECVKHLQSHLNSFGYGLAVDGAWGPNTNNAVRDFQSKHGLSVDGVVGPNTWNALHAGGGSSGTCNRNPAPATGSDRLSAGRQLNKGSALRSSDGSHSLHMQGDGNLVLYNHCGHATWATNVAGDRLLMQYDNNLVEYGPSGAVWDSRTTGSGASFLLVQNDGNLVLYTSSGRAVWDTRTVGQ